MLNLRLKKLKNKNGFTLIEMVIVITIIGILSSIAVTKYSAVQENAKKNADYATAANLATAAMLSKIVDGIDKLELGDADSKGDCTVLDSIIPLEKRGKADPLNPSNIERLEEVFCTNPAVIKGLVFPAKVTKEDSTNALKEMFTKYHEFVDLQTASAYAASKLRSDVTNDEDGTIVLVARNHPSLSQKEIKLYIYIGKSKTSN